MADMPRPRPPYLSRDPTRHGRVVWYRAGSVGASGFTPLSARWNSSSNTRTPWQAVQSRREASRHRARSHGSSPAIERQRHGRRSLWRPDASGRTSCGRSWRPPARIRWRGSPATRLSRGGNGARRRHHRRGTFSTPCAGCFGGRRRRKHVRVDPTAGVADPPRVKSGGFRPWTEDDVAAYERRWPIGTRQRVWLDVLLYTGLRRGDAVQFGRQHVRDGIGTMQTEKSGYSVTVTLPILPVLAATLAAGPCGDLAYIAGASGHPFTKESFGNEFREACRAAGVRGSAHGVRKIAATRAANAGATVAQLEQSWMVWRTHGVALHPKRRSAAAGIGGDAQARERPGNFYCRTQGEGATAEGKRSMNPTVIF